MEKTSRAFIKVVRDPVMAEEARNCRQSVYRGIQKMNSVEMELAFEVLDWVVRGLLPCVMLL